MEVSDGLNTIKNETTLPLNHLGWSTFFQEQLDGTDSEQFSARVIGVRKNKFLIRSGDGELLATMAGRLFNESNLSPPLVGDWVIVRDTVIISILDRKNTLSRGGPGGRSRKNEGTFSADQAIAANLDWVFIVCGLDRDFNLRRIERYLTLVYGCGLDPAIILTKSDLHLHPDQYVRELEKVALGVPVYSVSANDDKSISQLADLISHGQTVALIGSSGAGKSTLINRLAGKEVRITNEVGSRVGKGKHTTTTRDLIVLPSGGMVIDNPGIREVALTLDTEVTESAFQDIEAFAPLCRFKDCSHTHEPGCEVLEAVARGDIPSERLKNYQKLKNEFIYHSLRQNKSASRMEKERWKTISQKAKSIKKRRQ